MGGSLKFEISLVSERQAFSSRLYTDGEMISVILHFNCILLRLHRFVAITGLGVEVDFSV